MSEEEKPPVEENEVSEATPEAEGASADASPAQESTDESVPEAAAAASAIPEEEKVDAPSVSEAAPVTAAAVAVPPAAEAVTHAHSADHGADGHDDHGHGHVAPMTMLFGVLGALVILTIMTVAVTLVDLGAQWNFVIAMIIATVKAALVMGYFMHLVWDSKFNVVAFLSSFLFVILFLAMVLVDRQEYQPRMDEFDAAAKAAAAGN
jgi:cytochrome c oxidase subunit IV